MCVFFALWICRFLCFRCFKCLLLVSGFAFFAFALRYFFGALYWTKPLELYCLVNMTLNQRKVLGALVLQRKMQGQWLRLGLPLR